MTKTVTRDELMKVLTLAALKRQSTYSGTLIGEQADAVLELLTPTVEEYFSIGVEEIKES